MRESKHWIIPMLVLICGTALSLRAQQQVTVTGVVSIVRIRGNGSSKLDNANAVIWLRAPAGSTRRAGDWNSTPRPRFKILQQHKRFDPHVLVIPVGSVVEFPNLDPFFHNVFSLFNGKRFDLGLYEAGTTHTVDFDRAGIAYIFCNIHPEMSAVVVALNTPYYAVSDGSGQVMIRNVPPGEYHLQVWHERSSLEAAKALSRQFTVSEDAHSLGTIRLPESGDLI